ncbi:MAG: hypothetical protein ABIM46_01130 [candidate division WOR-3 bacterium]
MPEIKNKHRGERITTYELVLRRAKDYWDAKTRKGKNLILL